MGRQQEIGEVKRLLSESRLVTLTGVGGAGKSRLALRVGVELEWAFRDGVWFVDLTHIHDQQQLTQEVQNPDVLAYLVGATLGLRQMAGGPPLERVVEQLSGRQMLLVLDNCEHLLPASAILANALLLGCPELRIVATSREPLGMGGETAFPVPPLPAPDPRRRASLAETIRFESVALFLARAQAAWPDFQLTTENHVAVAALCHRLDGLPLAIELAAARVRALAPQQILARLTDRFALLSQGDRAAPERQQTLRACVDWSFDLCTKPERVLWTRSSVFVGGFELDAARGICTDEDLPAPDLLDVVHDLVDKSILSQDRHAEHGRYRMLETIRDYGQDKLREAGEDAQLRRRHRDWYEQLVTQASAEWVSDRQGYWLARLDREHPNLRAAMEYCLSGPSEAERAMSISVGLPPQWRFSRDLYSEELRWLDRALALTTAPTALRARALLLAAYMAGRHGDIDAMRRRLDEGEDLARRLHDGPAQAFAAFIRGAGAILRNDVAAATKFLRHGLSILPATSDLAFASAVRLQLLLSLGVSLGLAGDFAGARRCYEEILQVTEARGEGLNRCQARWGLGLLAWQQGELEEGAAQVQEGLRVSRACGWNSRFASFSIEVLAWILADQRQHRRAAIMLGAADTLRTHNDKPISAYQWMSAHHDGCERKVRDALGEAAFAAAFGHGQELSDDELFAHALDEL